MIKQLFYTVLIFYSSAIYAQTISGSIAGSDGAKIMLANIVTKDSVNAISIKEFVITKNGLYSITVTKPYRTLVLEVSVSNYQKNIFVIDSFIKTKDYTHNFILIKDTVVKLQDVVVKAKVRPFQISGDTVSYNVSAYRNGTERKIQDIIKKLPGIEVNEKTGEIKYKGKSVETVKLDGEDLFASNYSIGTKNINVDMVDKVQAIENYSDNPLLKGIEGGDKVALNLTLKTKKTNYSGSLDAGTGILGNNTALDVSATILGISKKYKSFSTVSYNNIGTNNTPFDYFSYNPNIEQVKEQSILAKKYIPETYFDSDIDPGRTNINNAFFGSYNAVFKVGKKLNLRTNLYYLTDKIQSEQLIVSANNINGQQFNTSDKYLIVKTPGQYRSDVEAKYSISKNALLEYSLRYSLEKIGTSNEVFQNRLTNYKTNLKTHDNYLKEVLTYTKKLSDKKAVQVTVRHSVNGAPQNYHFLPAIFDPLTFSENNQLSKFRKKNLSILALLLGNTSKGKYTTSITADFQDILYTSNLEGTNNGNEQLIDGFTNDFKYAILDISSHNSYMWRLNHFRITSSLNIGYLQQSMLDRKLNEKKDTANTLLEPSLVFSYKINSFSAFLLTAAYKQKPFSEDYLVANPVYFSNRLIKYNKVSLNIVQSKFLSATYLINNLYKQFQLNIGGSYLNSDGNFFSNLTVQPNSTKALYFYLPENNKTVHLNFMIEKYIPFLQGTVRLRNDYSNQRYKNIVNNSSIRNNVTQSVASELFFKTAFDIKVNFENIVRHQWIQTKSEGGSPFLNQAIHDNFQTIIKPSKRLFLLLSADFYLPNTNNTGENYFFFDVSANYQSKNKLYDFRFKAKNITNNKTLNQFDTNDYSTTNFKTNLLPRLFMISISRSF